ncbi:MAG: hypothetical protein JJU10_03720 [Idiomarina sp.]|nr:hypothetical protein [Idiomarina sp.]
MFKKLGLVSTLMLFAVGLTACSDGTAKPGPQAGPLSRVLVVEVESRDLDLERPFSARTEGSMVAEVRARAAGQIESLQ